MSFERNQDPIKSMGMGYGNKMNTNTWKILEFIKSFGKEGVRLTDIQKYIYVDLNGNSEEDFYKTTGQKQTEWGYDPYENDPSAKLRASRGYYNTLLYGGGMNGKLKGILPTYCERVGRKWRLVRMPEPGENLTVESLNHFVPETLNEMFKRNK